MFDDYKLNDAAAIPGAFMFFTDFIRQDDIADGGAIDFVAIGSGTIATQAANGGWVRLSGAATTDDSGAQIQALAAHACTTGKTLAMKTRGQLNESTSTNVVTESDLYIGLFPVDTSIVASLPADGIYFVKADGGTTITCVVRVASSNVFSVTLAATAYTQDKLIHAFGISIYPNGANSTVSFVIDGVEVARAAATTLPATSVFLTPTIAEQSGDNTGTKFLDVDYLGSWQLR